MAGIIVPVMSPEATGVSAPSVSSAPPTASDAPAAVAWRLPGLRPSVSKKPAVPSRPWPPNQPKSFWVPWPTNKGPTTKRSAVLPRSMRPPRVDCACKDWVSRVRARGNPSGRRALVLLLLDVVHAPAEVLEVLRDLVDRVLRRRVLRLAA